MACITIHFPDSCKTVFAEPGTCLADVLADQRESLARPCGGQGRCGKCRVRASGALSPLAASEERLLTAEEIAQGIRLSCCTTVQGDVHVWRLERKGTEQICTSGTEAVFSQQPMFSRLGAVVDIGTTTLAAQLYDQTGLLSAASSLNPQAAFGADVISRISHALQGNAEALASCVREGIDALLTSLCQRAERSLQELDALVITGNTTMLYLLAGEDVTPLSAAPFTIRQFFGTTIPAGTLNLQCCPDIPVYIPRCISAFVGGDITTALVATGLSQTSGTALLADIGTNGELALWHAGKLFCCSTAAGPAFEGATLTSGMHGAAGAVDHVWVQGKELVYHTIEDVQPLGICGSGVADLMAALRQTGRVDDTGYFPEEKLTLAPDVTFTQDDVRQVQLAKSAIRSGIEALLKTNGISYEAVTRVAVAGGFGHYLSLESAAAIGLIPPPLLARCESVGNAALSGGAMLLRSLPLQRESEVLASAAQTVDLAASADFAAFYMEHMMFQ